MVPGLEARLQAALRSADAGGRAAAARAFSELMREGDARQRLEVLRFVETQCGDWYAEAGVRDLLPDAASVVAGDDDALEAVVALTAPGNPPELREAAYAAVQYGASPRQVRAYEPTLLLWSRTRSEAANQAARGAWARLAREDPTGFRAMWLRWVRAGDARRLLDAARFLATEAVRDHLDDLHAALVPVVAAAPESHRGEFGRVLGDVLLDWHDGAPLPPPDEAFAVAAVALMDDLRTRAPGAFQYGDRSYENVLFCALAGAHRNGHADALPAYLDAAVSWAAELVDGSDAEGWMALMESVAPGMEEVFREARTVLA